MNQIIYIHGYQKNPKQSKKGQMIKHFFLDSEIIEFLWNGEDENIHETFKKFLLETIEPSANTTIIASSTGCNFAYEAIQLCKDEMLPRPHMVYLNPLFDLWQFKSIENTDDTLLPETLNKQIKKIDLSKIEDSLIIFSKEDEILVPPVNHSDLAIKNLVMSIVANHSMTNINFDRILNEIAAYQFNFS